MIALNSSRTKLILLVAVSAIALFSSLNLISWLTPAPSDIRLSFEQTSPLENSRLPQEALDNHMPQLGKGTFWLDGLLMRAFGHCSPYVVRYTLFVVSLFLMYLLYLRVYRREGDDSLDWSLVFLLTITGTFFFSIKFFFWLDYLVVLPLSLSAALLILRNSSPVILFLLTIVILYVKISGFFILFTIFGMFLQTSQLKRYAIWLITAVSLSVGYFIVKWGFASVADRGHSGILNFSAYSLMALNLLTKPWLIFSFFDKASQRIITSLDWIVGLKMLMYFSALAFLIHRKAPGLIFRVLCILAGFICSLVILRDHPTLHDFAAYNGIIELGLIALLWLCYREFDQRQKKICLTLYSVIFALQVFVWSQGLRAIEPVLSRADLVERLKDELKTRKNLFLFCSWNVGEFEYFLKDVRIHYSLWEKPFLNEELIDARPALLLIPRKCMHEKVTDEMRKKYYQLKVNVPMHFIDTLQIDKNQVYDLYEAR